ncbi:Negative elongation factor E [Halotydeus destructor]|nr:Negative elongation factor E [Halotydeus destructor]
MGFLELPKQLTEEEKILQQKYQKLKRKKKALQALKTPKPEQPPVQPLKRVSESGPKQDAKELAKKLLRTGAIAAIKAPEKREAFRRSKAVERKRAGDHKPGGYQPFSSTQSSDGGESDNLTPEPISPLKAQYSSKYSLYENFVSPKDA